MKVLGIVGGIAPESTVEYYRAIMAIYRERSGGQYPAIVINSIDLTKMLGLIGEKRIDEVVAYLSAEIERVVQAGAELGLLASNTPHLIFDQLRAASRIPLVSIVDAAADAAQSLGLRRLALFGTKFTMQAGFYAALFATRGIEVVAPTAADQELIHARYMDELIGGRYLPETRDELLEIARSMKRSAGIDGVILGGTELPLLLRDPEWEGLRFLDTGRIHAERAVSMMLA